MVWSRSCHSPGYTWGNRAKTTVQFVHSASMFVISVHMKVLVSLEDNVFPSVAGVPNVHVGFSVHVSQSFKSSKIAGPLPCACHPPTGSEARMRSSMCLVR